MLTPTWGTPPTPSYKQMFMVVCYVRMSWLDSSLVH